ncbi:MAG TPA: PD-(D/E)XK nuclease family protein, partial [Anaerolineae bacterium]|nr:PD-(D/E)XK nuclease family protein [Anaerolineae bacterium]
MPPQFLSHSKLATFFTCQQRFYLRYQRQLIWPPLPATSQWHSDSRHGLDFHRLLERHFLNLPINPPTTPPLSTWWQAFQQHPPPLPTGQRRPEFTLIAPLNSAQLIGRFDLLITTPTSAHIFDWKTGNPRPRHQLQQDWQTRLYLALLAQAQTTLGLNLAPHQLHLTYWYPQDPQNPVTFTYSPNQHDQDWAEITTIIAQIEAQTTAEQWPLTPHHNHCLYCPYQAHCHR